jgi:hypothetical protein
MLRKVDKQKEFQRKWRNELSFRDELEEKREEIETKENENGRWKLSFIYELEEEKREEIVETNENENRRGKLLKWGQNRDLTTSARCSSSQKVQPITWLFHFACQFELCCSKKKMQIVDFRDIGEILVFHVLKKQWEKKKQKKG